MNNLITHIKQLEKNTHADLSPKDILYFTTKHYDNCHVMDTEIETLLNYIFVEKIFKGIDFIIIFITEDIEPHKAIKMICCAMIWKWIISFQDFLWINMVRFLKK